VIVLEQPAQSLPTPNGALTLLAAVRARPEHDIAFALVRALLVIMGFVLPQSMSQRTLTK
jgi:hypothetical protein